MPERRTPPGTIGAATERRVRLVLEPRPEAARRARLALRRAGLGEDVAHTVELLVTEVVANALRHGITTREQRILLLATLGEDRARVEIADPGEGFDPATTRRGMGLRLLDVLAPAWSAERTGRGFLVRFEVDRRPSATSPGSPAGP